MRVNRREQGTSVFEMVILAPAIVFVAVFLIGLGQTGILRQHALVGARYAAFYQRVANTAPSAGMVTKSVSTTSEDWRSTSQQQSSSGDVLSALGSGAGQVFGFFQGLLSNNSGSIAATVTAKPSWGIIPRMFPMGNVASTYYLPFGSWTSSSCGAYLPLALAEVSIKGFNVNLPGI